MIEMGKKRPDVEAPLSERIAALEALCFKICEVTEANILNLETAVTNLKGQIESFKKSQEV